MAANVASNHFCITKWWSINPTQNKGNEEAADCRARRSKRRRWLASVPKARHACRLCLPLMLAKGQHSLVHSTTASPIPSAKARCLLPSRPLDAKYFLYTPSAPTTPETRLPSSSRLASRRLRSRLVTGEVSAGEWRRPVRVRVRRRLVREWRRRWCRRCSAGSE